MKDKSIKVYGTDLLAQYRELEQKQTTLRNRVEKRFKFLLDHSDDPYLVGFDKGATGSYSVDMMIFVIMRVEANYASQTEQLDMFNTKDKAND